MKHLFVEIENLSVFETIKRAADEDNNSYFIGNDETQKFGTPDLEWDQIAFIAEEQLIYARGVLYGRAEGGKFVPYDNKTDNQYELLNKEIVTIDTANSNDDCTLAGQGLTVRRMDNTKMAAVRTDAIGIAVANSDIMGEESPTQVSQVSLNADLQNGATTQLLNILGSYQFEALMDSIGIKWSITGQTDNGDDRNGFIEVGYLKDLSNWNTKGDFIIHIKDINGEYADSYYAIRNNGTGDSGDFAYLATEDYVDEKCPDWNIAEFDTAYITTHNYVGIEAPAGYAFDKLYVLIHWFGGAAPVATNLFGGFYEGTVTDASKQILRSNGTNKMGAAYFTANVINLNDTSAIAYGDAYMYNSNGSATALNNPVNSYGIGRFSHSNDFTHFSIHNYPTTSISEAYCCIKYQLKKL